VNIGIDLANAAIAGVLAMVTLLGIIALAEIISVAAIGTAITVGAGFIVVAGIALTFFIGNALENIEGNIKLTNVLIDFGRKVEDHFIAQGEQLKIDFETFSDQSASALTRTEAVGNIAATITNDVGKVI